ncbi:MAG: hypothetical protein QW620_07140 [Thermoplasmata archaeon]
MPAKYAGRELSVYSGRLQKNKNREKICPYWPKGREFENDFHSGQKGQI